MLYIGVDLGTSAVKLLVMDETGDIKKIVSKEYPLFFPHPGWSEQKPEDWFEKSMEGIKELTAECDKSQVAGISFGGQMHGLVALDKDDNVIRPAILWNDGRTGEETEYLNEVIGKDKLSEYTANIAFAGFTAPKILWMKKNDDAVLHVAPKSGGDVVTELTEAFIVPKGTMVKLDAAVWHLAAMPVNVEELQSLIVLPEGTYMNDCTKVALNDEQKFEIVI